MNANTNSVASAMNQATTNLNAVAAASEESAMTYLGLGYGRKYFSISIF
jgi:hypothetical protein